MISAPIFYEICVHILAKFNFGTKWEEMKELQLTFTTVWAYLKEDFWTYFSLFFARITIYIIPALIFFLLTRLKKDRRQNSLKTFLKCLNLQFTGYLIYQGLITIFALDYLLNLGSSSSSLPIYMYMFGYFFSLARKKEIVFGTAENNKF